MRLDDLIFSVTASYSKYVHEISSYATLDMSIFKYEVVVKTWANI